MQTFTIKLTRTIVQTADVSIQALSQSEAEAMAEDLCNQINDCNDLPEGFSPPEWELDSDSTEVIEVEEG